jgi:hypothetical protein
VAACLLAPPAAAQPPAASRTAEATTETIGVSLKNIRKKLDVAPAVKPGPGLRLEYRVDVIGKPPPPDFFKDFSLATAGGVKYGGPTHQELVNAMTPLPFRSHGGVDVLPHKKK